MIDGKHPVVLRMAGMSPGDLGGVEAHRRRKGGDLGHVDDARSGLNRRLIGKVDWAQRAAEEVEAMRLENFARELESLERRRRSVEVRKRLAEGPRDPWRATRHGPMREVILTANRDWFEETDDPGIAFNRDEQERRERAFEARALAWLRASFGDDVIHARADRDEEAYHIHAVILPRGETRDGRRMLQPSIHPMIKNYEEA